MAEFTCVIADSQGITREGLASLLSGMRACQLEGQASSTRQLVTMCRARHPDLLVLDSSLPSGGKMTAIRSARKRFPGTKIIALVNDVGQRCARENSLCLDSPGTSPCCAELDCMGQALTDGSDAVLLRTASRARVLQTVRTVAMRKGGSVVEALHRRARCHGRKNSVLLEPSLTPREVQVAELVAKGFCNKEIGSRLGIQSATVKKHIGHVLMKLRLKDRLQIALRVIGEKSPDYAAQRDGGSG